jgi:putative membrane protein
MTPGESPDPKGTFRPTPPWPTPDDVSVELSSRRTGMSFQRTRMSADRTLMSIIRTALALISFGFTIHQAFTHMVTTQTLKPEAPLRFGLALVGLGLFMLTVGIAYHVLYMRQLRAERHRMKDEGLVHAESMYPPSLTLITALLLWIIGFLVVAGMAFGMAPFR